MLTVKQDLGSPEEAEQQGLTNLETAKDMDREVVDNGDQYGFKGDSDLHFDLFMGRIKGILLLPQLGYEDIWDIDEIFPKLWKKSIMHLLILIIFYSKLFQRQDKCSD
jgi:hypothetical protein